MSNVPEYDEEVATGGVNAMVIGSNERAWAGS